MGGGDASVWQRAASAQALSQKISRESLDNRVGHEDRSISRSKGPQQLLVIDYAPACLDSVGDVIKFSENNLVAPTSMVTRLKHAVSGCLKHRSKVRWFIAGARNHLQANRPLEFSFEIVI